MNHSSVYTPEGVAGATGAQTSRDYEGQQFAPGGLLTEDAAQQMLAELRRDMSQQLDWQVQHQLAARRGPAAGEAVLALGSLAAGAGMTAVLVANSTTLVRGLWGTQSASHMNILPYIALVWLAVIAVNLIWARRR